MLAAVGCGTVTPVAWNVKIKKVTTGTIDGLDLVGVSTSEHDYWLNGVKPDAYWAEDSPIRKQLQDRRKTTKFETGTEFSLSRTDPIWKKWLDEGAVELMIMGNLPGGFSNDAHDPRRVLLPLAERKWPEAKNHTLEVEVSDVLIRVLTPQKP